MKINNSIFESYFLFFRLDTTKLGIKPEFVEFDFAGSPIIIKIPVIPIEIQLFTQNRYVKPQKTTMKRS